MYHSKLQTLVWRRHIGVLLWHTNMAVLIIYGMKESKSENCTDLVKNVMSSALKINEDKVRSMRFCGVHRLGKLKQNRSEKPRPVIARFTCREDRDLVWRERYNLKGSCFKLAEDLPPAVREIRKTILVPAMKEAKKTGRHEGYYYRRPTYCQWKEIYL